MIANFNSEVVIGNGILKTYISDQSSSNFVLITTKTPYKLFRKYFKDANYAKIIIKSNDISEINAVADSFRPRKFQRVIAFGSGTTIDFAKALSSKIGGYLVAIPTILSCNAFATNKSVVRSNSKLVSITSKTPDKVIIDLDIIKLSQERYNFAGVADVLSIFTALFDWNLAVQSKMEDKNQLIENISQSLLESMMQRSSEIFTKRDVALKKLAQMLLISGYVTNLYGSGRPESGSEHMFARAIEESGRYYKKMLHGEAVLLGILLCSELQCQKNDYFYDIATRINLLTVLQGIRMDQKQIETYLLKASKIRRDRFTIFNKINLSQKMANTIVTKVLSKLKKWKI
ncbi:iron-containing alcohol dehydrogenase [Candidatus Woesearchaeota archaeon]|nr:iron-containing alcohol dehydrogenase [Candidatus Woesearchaeota archaeon]